MIPFKENMVVIAGKAIERGVSISVNSATDALRLGVALSDGDVTLRTNTKFRNFSRPERRLLLSMLEGCNNFAEDAAMRRGVWKRYLRNLHPNDYTKQFPRVVAVQNTLYKGEKIATHNSLIEQYISEGDARAIALAVKRPGDFARRLQNMLSVFGMDAATPFAESVVPKLTTFQLLKLRNYVLYTNIRNHRMFPPKGNWSRVQIVENKLSIANDCQAMLLDAIDAEVGSRVDSQFPDGVTVDETAGLVKLKDNDSTLTDYGRGTAFPLPDNVNFIRTASYWEHAARNHNVWFDNGFNFFDDEWKSMGTVCWNATNPLFNKGCVFSGDPTNSKDSKGRACQMIDLYVDKLAKAGVRYAVWSILCFSKIKFSAAECVQASLQWGENPVKGKLFEPSRCQLSFPINSDNLTSYIAYLDVAERKIVYMDVGFAGQVNSAKSNEKFLSANMPAYLEYLDTLPSIGDLFANVKSGPSALVTYSDVEYDLDGQQAYVFRPENANNSYEDIDINDIL